MADENTIQALVHALEEGGWVKWLKLAMIIAITVTVAMVLLTKFRGLDNPRAMELAEISREVERGHGLSTLMIRPIEIPRLLSAHHGEFPIQRIPETFHPPLYPVVMAPFLLINGKDWKISPRTTVPKGDLIIASAGVFFFLLAVGANYFLIRRLFDGPLAGLSCGFLLLSEPLWRYAMSGLPQIFLLLLFTGALYALVRAVEVEGWPQTAWLAAMTAGFGLMALTHGLTIFCFVGAIAFVLIALPQRLRHLAVMLGVFLVLYTPWLVRNYLVFGNPAGSSAFIVLQQVIGPESEFMRRYAIHLPDVTMSGFRVKMSTQFSDVQLGLLYQHLGYSLPAAAFFFALLNQFRKRETRALQWGLVLMWIASLLGMLIFGLSDDTTLLQSNELNLLFIPLFIAYGLAFLLKLWQRLELKGTLVRNAFLAGLYLISGTPLITVLTAAPSIPVQWPPYIPAVIGAVQHWMQPDEIVATDMPWAVAWYGDRRSLWLPETPAILTELHDFNQLGAGVNGLFLSPVTGNQPFVGSIARGTWKDWAPFIMRQQKVKDFPLTEMVPMVEGQIVFYSDHDRWSDQSAAQ